MKTMRMSSIAGTITGLVIASSAGQALAATTVYASYTGSQQGVTQREQNLNQTNSFNTGVNASGIAVGVSNDLYLAAGNHLLNYGTAGNLINDMTFPDPAINYTDVDVGGGRVVASYKGSQQGVTIRNYGLGQLNSFNTGFNINGIAAGANNNVYLASGNHLYDYDINGTLITNMTFPDAGINYTDVDYGNGMVVASYNGSQRGVTLRNLSLAQTSFFSVAFDIDAIALGTNSDVYLASGNHLYDYALDGALITDMTFPDSRIAYTGIAVSAPVPEPETYALMLAGLGILGFVAGRRAKAGAA